MRATRVTFDEEALDVVARALDYYERQVPDSGRRAHQRAKRKILSAQNRMAFSKATGLRSHGGATS